METFNEQLTGVINRMRSYVNDMSKVQTDHVTGEWGDVYLELNTYLMKESANLQKVIEQGDGVELLPTGRKRRPKSRLRIHERQILDQIYDVIRNDKHVIFNKCDILDVHAIFWVMVVFEVEPGYFHTYHTNRESRTRLARELGGMIARDGVFIKKKATEYTPVDPDAPPKANGKRVKKSNKVCNLWIIRNEHLYRNMGPADFNREFARQKKEAIRLHAEEFSKLYPDESPYNNQNKRVIAPPQLEQAPSFL